MTAAEIAACRALIATLTAAHQRGDVAAEDAAAHALAQRAPALLADNDRLRAGLAGLRRGHQMIEDCWYSCPKSGECCDDDRDPDRCTCGADAQNAVVDRLLQEGTL